MSINSKEFSNEENSSQALHEYNSALSSSLETRYNEASINSHIVFISKPLNVNPVTSDAQRQSTNTNQKKPDKKKKRLDSNTSNEYFKRSKYANEEILEVNLAATFSGNPSTWSYEIMVAQQPVRARMCGFGDKDRRPLSPAPVVQLIVKDIQGKMIQPKEINCSLFVVHASLWKENGIDEAMIVAHLPSRLSPANSTQSLTNNLLGNRAASPYTLNDINGIPGVYFIFSDLSVRTDGEFKLIFNLMDLGIATNYPSTSNNRRKIINVGSPASDVLASVSSNSFEVFPAKKFPGMLESTALIRCFSNQGLKIPVRNSHLTKHNSQEPQSEESSDRIPATNK
ncbi:12388_t:CDS:2 [Ambispora gerdemannii]|uniref:12388_t:CDS:1 n=1 Tax=Ambispora gerdemannii TaxID=144530 RepID=A0A9N9GLP2_9GLOM|nr:12388_t:CDS:2 [Ambispora gerdemannii]